MPKRSPSIATKNQAGNFKVFAFILLKHIKETFLVLSHGELFKTLRGLTDIRIKINVFGVKDKFVLASKCRLQLTRISKQ